MRTNALFICLMLGSQWSVAQSLLAAAGGDQSSAQAQLQWSMGECFIGDYDNTSHHFSIGFQQPIAPLEVVAAEDLLPADEISFYPNPFIEYLYIALPEKMVSNFDLNVMQMKGQKIEAHVETIGDRLRINATHWPPGVYLIQLVHKNRVFVSKVTKL